jgi:LysM repeat protein
MPANRNKLAFYYFMAAILLFAGGYALAWFSEQPVFSKEVLPKSHTAAKPTATPEAAKPDEKKASTKPGTQYEVEQGDTISKIAEDNGIDFEELAKYNNIPYPYDLTPGQIIVIPKQ